MSRLLATATAVALGVTLVGCGSSSRPHLDPDVAGKPTWAGCHGRSIESIDYVPDAAGKPTRRAAAASYRSAGDHLVRQPASSHHPARWLLVDDHDVIHVSLGLLNNGRGWLVDTVERCAP